jgi:peptide/nickel transport system substrate-binding protein
MHEHRQDAVDAARLSRRELLQYGSAAAVGASGLSALLAESTASASVLAKPKRGGSVKLAISDSATSDSLDPATTFSIFGTLADGMIYDTLVRLDNQWHVTPMLAEDWSVSRDATEYTFKLRKGVQFHTGKNFDARDVEYVMRRMINKKAASNGYGLFAPLLAPSGIKVLNPTTIRFKLKQPDGFFLIRLGFGYSRIYQAGADFKSSQGTGPFKSVSFKGGDGFKFVRNENYWQSGLPYLDAVSGVVITEAATKTQAVLTGDTDMIDPPDWSTFPQFANASDINVLKSPYGPAFVFGIDGSKKPFSDPKVRKAMKMLVDRKRFVDVVCRGQATVSADTVVNPADPFYPRDLKPVPYDPEQAKSLLKSAGYSGGWDETIFTSTCCRGMADGGVLLRSTWAQANIKSSVKNETFDQLFSKDWLQQPVVVNYWLRLHPANSFPFMYASDGAWNESRLKDPKIDQLIKQAQATTKRTEQKRLFDEVQHRYNDEAASIWPFHMFDYWPHKKRLNGTRIQPTDLVDFRSAYVT